MLRAGVLATWLALSATASLDALAQDDVIEPSASGVVEVAVGRDNLVRIPASEEILVVEATQIDVTQVSSDTLRVNATGTGRAVVMLRGPRGFTSLVIRTAIPEPGRPIVPSVPTPTGGPEVAFGGAYQIYGDDAAVVGPDMLHWAGASHHDSRLAADAFASVRRLVSGQWGLQDVRLGGSGEGWRAEVGDVDEELLVAVEGLGGAYATMRGLRGHAGLGDTGFTLGAVAGGGRRLGCCSLVEFDSLALAGLTAGWSRGESDAQLLGGVMWVDQQGPMPLVRLRGGFSTDATSLSASVVQSGPGTGGSLNFRARAAPPLEVYAEGQGHTASFVRPQNTWGQGGQVGGRAGLRYSPLPTLALGTDLLARQFGGPSARFEGGARVRADWRPLQPLTIGAGYQKTLRVVEGTVGSGDTALLSTMVGTRRWYAGVSGYVDLLPSSRRRSLFLSATAGWSPTKTVTLDAGYRVSALNDADDAFRLDQSWIGLQARTRAIDATFTVSTNVPVGGGEALGTVATSMAWRIRRFLEFGIGGYATTALSFAQRVQWSTTASWTFRPTALGRAEGGLGLRGRVAGVVFLDLDRDGERDEGEKGLPGMTLSTDDGFVVVTDEDGRFEFHKLPGGPQEISLDRQGMYSIGPTRRLVQVGGSSEEILFPLVWGGRIQGILYDDIHGNGTFDNGDPGVRCEMVMLRNEKGVIVETVYAEGGRFQFSGLAEGEYTVMVDAFGLPEGYSPVDDLEPTVFVEEGKPLNLQIRLHANRAIGGVVWEDQDRDGRGDGKRDLGIGGAEVYLSTGEIVRTGPDGSFLFRDLAPGAYAVRTELGTEAKVVVLPVEPKEVLDLAFVLPRGTRPPAPSVRTAPKPADSVAGLVLEAPMTVLPQGVELQVTATAVLSNGETREVTTRANWQSSDTSILSVSDDGVVRGKAAGTAGVTAEWKGGVGSPLSFEVLGLLDRVTVSPVGLRLNPGNTADLRVDVVDRSGRGGLVTPVAVWSVADPRVARVDSSGRLKALKDGVTTVQARIGETWSPPLEVQVITAEVTALSIENLPARMPEGATVQLKATGYDTRLEVQNVTESVTWASSDPAVVRVEPDGRIIAVGRGTAQITASIGSLFTRSRTVFVTNTPPLAIEVIPPGMTLSMYDLQKFRVSATFEDGSKGAITTVVEWIVDGTAAMVRPDGVVVPREPGTCTIKARYLGVESNAVTVTVEPR